MDKPPSRESKLEKLLDLGRRMAENRMLDPLLEYAMAIALDLLDAECGYLALPAADGELDFRVRLDRHGGRPGEYADPVDHSVMKTVMREQKSRVLPDPQDDPEQNSELASAMCVPMISRGRVLGAIHILNRPGEVPFKEEDLPPLKYFAAQAAIAIENARTNEDLDVRVRRRPAELNQKNLLLEKEIKERKKIESQLQELAITDPLTGLYNRRHFFEISQGVFSGILGLDIPLSALMIDADHFKDVNDQHGHLIGDQVLQGLATRLKKNLRADEILGRYGGEEFAVLLPETSLKAARQVAERLRADIDSNPIPSERGSIRITVTIGAACISDLDERIDQLLDKADKALYKAKQAGRNRVATWEQV